MSDTEKYDTVFIEAFLVQAGDLPDLKYQGIVAWDSVGHMQLMAALEECFGIELEVNDIIEFSSYKIGKEILGKYGITV